MNRRYACKASIRVFEQSSAPQRIRLRTVQAGAESATWPGPELVEDQLGWVELENHIYLQWPYFAGGPDRRLSQQALLEVLSEPVCE